MNAYGRQLLAKILELTETHRATQRPKIGPGTYVRRHAETHPLRNWGLERDHGPRVVALYAVGDEAARKRCSRTLQALAGQGLVELWGPDQNITHVRLTAAGQAVLAPQAVE
jgi:hypothetical protein